MFAVWQAGDRVYVNLYSFFTHFIVSIWFGICLFGFGVRTSFLPVDRTASHRRVTDYLVLYYIIWISERASRIAYEMICVFRTTNQRAKGWSSVLRRVLSGTLNFYSLHSSLIAIDVYLLPSWPHRKGKKSTWSARVCVCVCTKQMKLLCASRILS